MNAVAEISRDSHVTLKGPGDDAGSPLSQVLRQPFMVGLFLPIQSGGWTPSTLPRTTSWTFDYNAALTRRAEELNLDLVFGLSLIHI